MIKKYGKYKESGVAWLGEVPDNWEVHRIKEVGDIRYGIGQPPEYVENGFPLIRATNVDHGKISEKGLVFIRKEDIPFERNPFLKTDDIIIVRSGAYTADSAIIPKKFNGAIAGFDMVLRPQSIFPTLLSYILLSNYVLMDQLILCSFRAAQPHLNKEELGYTQIFVPPSAEQTAIASYLDTKTATIDQKIILLAKKAERYRQLKQSLINETVTRGLNKKVKLKDSGVEWIGEVPEHWEVRRLKDLGNLVLGKMLDNAPGGQDKELKYYLKSKNIGWLTPNINMVEEMWFSLYEINLYRIKKGDLLFSEGGEVGKTCYWNNELEECYLQNSVHKFTAHMSNKSRFFLYLSFAAGKFGYYDSIVNFVSIKHLTKEKLLRVLWLKPPLTEQTTIANYLDKKCAHIDAIVNSIDLQIEKLKELRKTLINDVVTGKVKVT